MTSAQRLALENLWDVYGVERTNHALNLDALFGRYAPRTMEIGCGAGEVLLAMAKRYPENDYLGVDVYRAGIGRVLRQLQAQALTNVRLIYDDVVTVLRHQIGDWALDSVYILFPDPWPKKRHHKRRLIQPDFVELLQKKLKSHGRLFIATDWEDYAEHIREVVDRHPGFVTLAGNGGYAPRPRWRPVSRYERRAMDLGHRIQEFAYALRSGRAKQHRCDIR